ncbi:phenoloxidase-activating factor 2-like [Anopheles aquasalis]|uniref:phenoloxidase-activating factor 2-like n=1 Tax=Anopheles aquasalis TaxID=42839 RepID=UPI00215AA4F8|nr:phenoloxidase-activating factor 2-like [Anopheles aquasalis]
MCSVLFVSLFAAVFLAQVDGGGHQSLEIISSTSTNNTSIANDTKADESSSSANNNEENLSTSPSIDKPLPAASEIGCGQRSKDRWETKELTGGLEDRAEYGEIPWMVAIFQMPFNDYGPPFLQHCCNGALISERAVLTTAYCLESYGGRADRLLKDVRVRVGHTHPDYSDFSLINNIAVLELANAVQYGPTIQPVCLPEKNFTIGYQENFIFSGWGETVKATKPTKGHNLLKKVILRNTEWAVCKEEIAPYDPSHRINLHNSLVCATRQHEEIPCREDTGAPVVAEVPNSEDRYYLHGLVSWGYHCRQKNRTSAALTNVRLFREWIDSTLTQIAVEAT